MNFTLKEPIVLLNQTILLRVPVGVRNTATITADSSVEVSAIRVTEHFAIHRSVEKHLADQLVVAHIGTGFFVAKCDSQRVATAAAHAIEALPIDWDFTDPATPRGWSEATRESVKKIQAAAVRGDTARLRTL